VRDVVLRPRPSLDALRAPLELLALLEARLEVSSRSLLDSCSSTSIWLLAFDAMLPPRSPRLDGLILEPRFEVDLLWILGS